VVRRYSSSCQPAGGSGIAALTRTQGDVGEAVLQSPQSGEDAAGPLGVAVQQVRFQGAHRGPIAPPAQQQPDVHRGLHVGGVPGEDPAAGRTETISNVRPSDAVSGP